MKIKYLGVSIFSFFVLESKKIDLYGGWLLAMCKNASHVFQQIYFRLNVLYKRKQKNETRQRNVPAFELEKKTTQYMVLDEVIMTRSTYVCRIEKAR